MIINNNQIIAIFGYNIIEPPYPFPLDNYL